MNALTLGATRPTIARVLGVCESSSKVPVYLNESQSRLLNRSDKPVGSVVRYRFCAGCNGCLTWPRFIRTIEAFAICKTPGVIRNSFFEFIGWPNGIGLQDDENMCGTMLLDRDPAPAFDDVISSVASPRRIALIAMNWADAGKRVTLRYIDNNGQKKYSSIDGVVQEGERLTLVSPNAVFPANAVFTSSYVASSGLYHVVKDVTQYPVLMYESNDTPTLTKFLSQYEPSEEVPIYRRSFIPGLNNTSVSSGVSEDCTFNKQITAVVKLQHVPVVVDNDPLVIGNLAALKLMVMAILREEQNRHDEAVLLESKAAREIDGELSSYMGDGMMAALKVGPDFGAGLTASGWRGWW